MAASGLLAVFRRGRAAVVVTAFELPAVRKEAGETEGAIEAAPVEHAVFGQRLDRGGTVVLHATVVPRRMLVSVEALSRATPGFPPPGP